jgi:hypothetical protein
MIPSITWRCSRNGRPRRPDDEGINGSIRAHWASDRETERDMIQGSPLNPPELRRHALAFKKPIELIGDLLLR